MIRAAFFDIDGTLLSFKTHAVSDGTFRALHTLKEAGVRCFISTGRPRGIIPPIAFKFDGYITMNGALVSVDDKILLSNPIPDEDSRLWIEYAKKNSICTMAFTDEDMLVAQPNATAMAIRNQLEFEMPPIVDIDDMRKERVYQFIAIMDKSHDKVVEGMLAHCRLPRWHPMFSDLVADNNSKAVGMEVICKHFGIDQEHTIAFGDGGNDIEMLRWAGMGIAMGNAEDVVKEHADMVTLNVDNEGIEMAVKQLLSI